MVTKTWKEGDRELVLHGYKASVWNDEKVLETTGGHGGKMVSVFRAA